MGLVLYKPIGKGIKGKVTVQADYQQMATNYCLRHQQKTYWLKRLHRLKQPEENSRDQHYIIQASHSD